MQETGVDLAVMTVAPPNTTAPTPSAVADNDDRESQAAAAPDAFAALLAVAQSGAGRRLGSVVSTLHHESVPFGGGTGDARRQRLEQMTEQADASRNARPSSRLESPWEPGAAERGPRAARLALEEQEASSRPGRETGNPVPEGKSQAGPRVPAKTGEPSAASARQAGVSSTPHAAKNADGPATARPPGDQATVSQTRPATGHALGDKAMSPVNSPAESAGRTPPPVGPADPAVARAPRQSEPVANQMARILSARGSGAAGPRAVTGVEQAVTAKVPAGSTGGGQPATKAGRGAGNPSPTSQAPDTRAAETTQRSDFDRLVRSIRLNLGATRSTVRMRLDPPELGRIQIEARMDGQRIELLVRTETDTAGELLRTRIAQLQAALQQHGLSIERLEIVSAQQHNVSGGDANTSAEDTDQPAMDQDAGNERPGGERQPNVTGTELPAGGLGPDATADQTDEMDTEPTEIGDELVAAGHRPDAGTAGAAAEPRLDVRV